MKNNKKFALPASPLKNDQLLTRPVIFYFQRPVSET